MYPRTDDEPGQQGATARRPWNKGRLVGQKPPLKLKDLWGIRLHLQLAGRTRDLALFNLAFDSKLRGCDLVRLRVADVAHGAHVLSPATVLQQETGRPVRFELTEPTREAVEAWLAQAKLGAADPLFPSRSRRGAHLSTRQYARIVKRWVALVGLDPRGYGAHSLRRTKATLIYRRTKNLRALQLLLGHSRIESTVRYLGVEVDDALELAEQTEV
jgi:integrase